MVRQRADGRQILSSFSIEHERNPESMNSMSNPLDGGRPARSDLQSDRSEYKHLKCDFADCKS